MSEHLTVDQAAKALKKSRNGILWLIRGGKLDAEKVINPAGRAMWLVRAKAVVAYKKGKP